MITAILFVLAGFFNSIMDIINSRWNVSVFSKIKNPKIIKCINPFSWQNMWKNGDYKQGEKFLGSSTIFCWLTNLWHFSKTMMIVCLCLGAIFYKPIYNLYIDPLILFLCFTLTFQLFYGKIWIKKK